MPRYNSLSLVKFSISLGMAPEKSLYDKPKICKYVQFNRVDGIPPWNMFPDKERYSRKGRLPQISGGISPDNLLKLKSRYCKEDILEIKEGNEPESRLSWK